MVVCAGRVLQALKNLVYETTCFPVNYFSFFYRTSLLFLGILRRDLLRDNMRLLFLYFGRDGQAKKITQSMADCLPGRVNYEIYNIRHFSGTQLSRFDAVIIDMSVRYGHFHHDNHQFVQAYADILNNMNSALFTVSLVARKTYKCTPETNSYTHKLLQPISWRSAMRPLPGPCAGWIRRC